MKFFHLFDSSIGVLGAVWSDKGLSELVLPQKNLESTLKKRGYKKNSPPPGWVDDLEEEVQKLVKTGEADFTEFRLDLSAVTEFQKKVYGQTMKLGPGKVSTYSEIAKKIGRPKGPRAVGQALGKNPLALVIPCHRVVGKNGSMTGFSAEKGISLKKKLLKIEAISGRPE